MLLIEIMIRPHTWVVVEEVRRGSWGIGGRALGLPEVRALQAAGPAEPSVVGSRR